LSLSAAKEFIADSNGLTANQLADGLLLWKTVNTDGWSGTIGIGKFTKSFLGDFAQLLAVVAGGGGGQ
jgi:hypothetical protein